MWAQKNDMAVLGFLNDKGCVRIQPAVTVCPILYQQQ